MINNAHLLIEGFTIDQMPQKGLAKEVFGSNKTFAILEGLPNFF